MSLGILSVITLTNTYCYFSCSFQLRIPQLEKIYTVFAMPALTLHLFAFNQGTDPKAFVQKLRQAGITVVVSSRPRYVVVPTTLDTNPLVSQKWDLLVLLQTPGGTLSLPNELQQAVRNEYKIVVGIPSKLLGSYPERDAKLKREASSFPLTGSLENARGKSSSKNLEVSPDLLAFMDELTKEHDKPVTMLNLLQFHHPDGKKNYYQYGQVCAMLVSAVSRV